MAEGKKIVSVYVEWGDLFEKLNDDEAGRLIKHFFRYVTDQHPEAPDKLTDLLFEPIKKQLQRDLIKWIDKCAKNKENAHIRWDANACERKKPDAKHADEDDVEEEGKEKDIINKSDLIKSPLPIKSKVERESNFKASTLEFTEYPEKMLNDFIRYWTESKTNGNKMRYELQPTFDISRRLVTWSGKDFNQNKGQASHPAVIHISDENTKTQLDRFKA